MPRWPGSGRTSTARTAPGAANRALILRDPVEARLFLRYHAESRTSFHRSYRELVKVLQGEAERKVGFVAVPPNVDEYEASEAFESALADSPNEPSFAAVESFSPNEPSRVEVAPISPNEPSRAAVAPISPNEPSRAAVASVSPNEPSRAAKAVATATSPNEPSRAPAVAAISPNEPSFEGWGQDGAVERLAWSVGRLVNPAPVALAVAG